MIYLLKFSIGCFIFREEIVAAVCTQREKFDRNVGNSEGKMNRWRHTRLQPGMFSFRWLTVTSSCISATTKCASSPGRMNWLLGWGGLLVMITFTWWLLWFFPHSSVRFVHFLFLFFLLPFCCCRFCWKQVCMWLKYLVGFLYLFRRKMSFVTWWINTSWTTGLNWWWNLASVTCCWWVLRKRQIQYKTKTNADVETLAGQCTVLPGFEIPWKQLRIISFAILKDPTYGRGSWVFAPFEAETQACLRQADDSMQCIISHLGKSFLKFSMRRPLSLNS